MKKRINHLKLSKRDDYDELLIANEKRKNASKYKKRGKGKGTTIGDLLKKDGKAKEIEKAVAKKKSEMKMGPIKMGDMEIVKTPPVKISESSEDDADDEEEDFS